MGQALASLGWAERMAVLARPLMRLGRLGDTSGAAFTAALFSQLMANTMLVTFQNEGRISSRELRLSYLVNTGLPVFFLHLPTTVSIIVPLVGLAGVGYLGLVFLAACLRTLLVLLYARTVPLPVEQVTENGTATDAPLPGPRRGARDPRGISLEIWRKFRRRFLRVALYTAPIYVLIFLAHERGVFDWLRDSLTGSVNMGFLPVEAAGVIVFSLAAEFTSGVAAAGALLHAGALSPLQVVLALTLGNLVATPVRALRHQLPSHMGLFSPRLGLELLLTSQSLRVASLLVVAAPLLFWA